MEQGRGQQLAVRLLHLLESPLEAALKLDQRVARALARRAVGLQDPVLMASSWAASCATCGFSRYLAMVGTRVRDRQKEAIIAKTTASAIGTNR